MTNSEIFSLIEKTKIIPAVKIENAEDAVSVAKALSAGGINIIEFTYRTAAAGDAIAEVCKNCPGLLTGAGTITGNGFLFGTGACYRLAAAGSRLAVGFGMCLSAGAGTITGNRFLFGAGACYRLAAGHLLTTACFRLNMIFSA